MEHSVRIVSMTLPLGHVLSPDPGVGPHAASDKTWFLYGIMLPLFTKNLTTELIGVPFTADNTLQLTMVAVERYQYFFSRPVSVCLVTMGELFEHSRTCPM